MKDLTTLEKRILIAASELLLDFDSISTRQLADHMRRKTPSVHNTILRMKTKGLLRWPTYTRGEIIITQIGEKWLELIQDEDI